MIEIRASSISSYSDCARRAMADALYSRDGPRLGLRDMIGINIGALMGTVIHKIVGADMENEGKASEWLEAELKKESKRFGGIRFDKKKTPGLSVAASQLRGMAHRVKDMVEEWNMGSVIEKDMSRELSLEGEKFVLGGRPDRISGDYRIHDLKTGAAWYGAMPHAAQLGAYTILSEKGGHVGGDGRIKECLIHFIPRSADDEIKEGRLERDACVGMARVGLTTALRAWKNWGKRGNPDDIDANPRSMLCSADYCRAHGTPFCKISQKKA